MGRRPAGQRHQFGLSRVDRGHPERAILMGDQPMPADHLTGAGGVFRRLRRLLRDSGATVLIEFAVALPILCGMTLGLYEITQGVITYMKVVDVANTVSDLIGQQSKAESGIADQDLDNYYIAGE